MEGVKFREVAQRVRDKLDRYLIALIIMPESGGLHEMLASGVLLRRGGRSGILTAGHVGLNIKEVLEDPTGRIAKMAASTKKASQKRLDGATVEIPLKLRSSRLRIVGGEKCGARRPDIAWIPLTERIASQLESETAHGFYEWDTAPTLREGNYHVFVSGCIGVQTLRVLVELGELGSVAEFRQVKYVRFPERDTREGWDYMTVMVDKEEERDTEERIRPPGIPDEIWDACDTHPTDFRAMSGGPMWCVREGSAADFEDIAGNAVLWGMCFTQWGKDAKEGVEINCHGPGSIERITARGSEHSGEIDWNC